MRQIHICAWLVVTPVALAACGGGKFTSDRQSGAVNADPAVVATAGSSHRNQSSSGDSGPTGSGGSAPTGGASSSGGAHTGGSGSGGASSAAGSAGSSAQGGAQSEGGAGGDAGEVCPTGAVTFRMLPGPELAHDYLCDAGCGTGWLTIADADGASAYSLFSACGTASCDSCEVQPCAAAACLATPLTAEGSQLVWTGSYLAKSTCGANMSCQKSDCAKAGKYKAKACAAVNAGPNGSTPGCVPKNEQLCAEAEFDFPSTQTVELVLKKL